MCKVIDRVLKKLTEKCPLLVRTASKTLKFTKDILSNAEIRFIHDHTEDSILQFHVFRSGYTHTVHFIKIAEDETMVAGILSELKTNSESYQFADHMYTLYLQCELVKMTFARLSSLPIITTPMPIPDMLTVVEDHFKYMPFVGSEVNSLGKGMNKTKHRRTFSL